MDQRTQEYNDLLEALQSMQIVTDDLPKHHIFLIMWLLQTGNLKLDWRSQVCLSSYVLDYTTVIIL